MENGNLKKQIAVAISAIALLSGLAACSSSAKSMTDSSAGKPAAPVAAASPFGAGCSAVPTDAANPGSFDAMSKVPVATAASGNPVLSTLVTAVTKAGLVDTLNNTANLTVIAPDNAAFAKIPAADLAKVLADKATLTKVLTYHVIPGKLSPDQLAGTHKTLEGADVTITGSGTNFTINGTSMVVCGDVQTANATVYIVDSVLMPTS
jgi:uncharacterized surface protein with fasciclin (FAS1) repeats